jgi:Phage tail assembly chaperone protein
MIIDNTPQPELTEELIKFMIDSRNENLRKQRNNFLKETDKYVLIDYPIPPEQLAIIKEYRQALRDFTSNNYELPEKPEFLNILY